MNPLPVPCLPNISEYKEQFGPVNTSAIKAVGLLSGGLDSTLAAKKLDDFIPEDSWPETRMMIDKVVDYYAPHLGKAI